METVTTGLVRDLLSGAERAGELARELAREKVAIDDKYLGRLKAYAKVSENLAQAANHAAQAMTALTALEDELSYPQGRDWIRLYNQATGVGRVKMVAVHHKISQRQLEVIEWADSPERVLGCFGSIRSGKTHSAPIAFMIHTQRLGKPYNHAITGRSLRQIEP